MDFRDLREVSPNTARRLNGLTDTPPSPRATDILRFDEKRLDDLRDYLALLGYQELTCTIHTTREDFPHLTIELRQEQQPDLMPNVT